MPHQDLSVIDQRDLDAVSIQTSMYRPSADYSPGSLVRVSEQTFERLC